MIEKKDYHRVKYNICIVSVLVILIGTIIYPVVLKNASDIREVRLAEHLKKMELEAKSQPVIILTNDLPGEVQEDPKPEVDSKFVFERNLRVGDTGEDVLELQKFLNQRGFLVASSGLGSPGNETDLFGRGTKDALARFQEANSKELLEPYGLIYGTGYFGDTTREFINNF